MENQFKYKSAYYGVLTAATLVMMILALIDFMEKLIWEVFLFINTLTYCKHERVYRGMCIFNRLNLYIELTYVNINHSQLLLSFISRVSISSSPFCHPFNPPLLIDEDYGGLGLIWENVSSGSSPQPKGLILFYWFTPCKSTVVFISKADSISD